MENLETSNAARSADTGSKLATLGQVKNVLDYSKDKITELKGDLANIAIESIGNQKLDTKNLSYSILTKSTKINIPVFLEPNTEYKLRLTTMSVNIYSAIREQNSDTNLILLSNYTNVNINSGVDFNSGELSGWYNLFIQIAFVYTDNTVPKNWMVSYAENGLIPYEDFIQTMKLNDNLIFPNEQFVKGLHLTDDAKETIINSFYKRNVKKTAHIGDSLTNGVGASEVIKRYPNRLNEMIAENNEGYSFVNRGIGGETSENIAIMNGAYYDYVEPFTIPSDTSKTAITKSSSAGKLGLYGGQNPVTINGVKGNIEYSDGTFYFSRIESGTPVNITHRTPVIYNSAIEDINKRLIIWMGTNDTSTTKGLVINDVINRYRRIIDKNRSGQYIIIGLTIDYPNRTEFEHEMEIVFGINFLNMREYLISYGLSDNGLTATTEDTTAISNGNIPPQLLTDGTHFNDYGYYAIAKAVYQRGQLLGYWN